MQSGRFPVGAGYLDGGAALHNAGFVPAGGALSPQAADGCIRITRSSCVSLRPGAASGLPGITVWGNQSVRGGSVRWGLGAVDFWLTAVGSLGPHETEVAPARDFSGHLFRAPVRKRAL